VFIFLRLSDFVDAITIYGASKPKNGVRIAANSSKNKEQNDEDIFNLHTCSRAGGLVHRLQPRQRESLSR
jgi:hypothetical protein